MEEMRVVIELVHLMDEVRLISFGEKRVSGVANI